MIPLPCPFCGVVLVETKSGWDHRTLRPACHLGGFHLGKELVESWNRRANITPLGGLYMEVKNNDPIFNDIGQGQRVEASFLNQVIEYYKGLLK